MPIAITGIGCRFPGAHGPDELWRLLVNGIDMIREVPPTRFDVKAYEGIQLGDTEKPMSRWGGFVDDVEGFDAPFFGISPREAVRMDPQQRLLLETTWEALEDAGEVPARLAGSATGVFIGQIASDYGEILRRAGIVDLHAAMGTSARCALAGRISYALDLRGPSVAVDTACSSALEAIHLACQSLRAGESTLAVAGGVNLILLPEPTLMYSRAGMLAADGRCKFGDASADGFVRSDGVGIVVLKPLSMALRDGDPVRAVIVGSATNNDGQGSGYLTAPAISGQEDMMRRAYDSAGVDPAEVDYLEAHGTGTPVGDPVELRAAIRVLGARRRDDRPFLVGSIKTNIGHTEGAAGVAGLIKAVLCLQHRMVPPNLHFRTPNPDIDWSAVPFRIPQEAEPLPARDRPRLVAVNSFGISGSNAHVILRESVEQLAPSPVTGKSDDGSHLLVLSARDPRALVDLALAYADRLRADIRVGGADVADVCYTAAVRRSQHEHRVAVSGESAEEVAERLDEFGHGRATHGVITQSDIRKPPRIAFVFPGQGSQWVGMGRRLLDESRTFADAMRECDQVIRAETGWSLLDRIGTDDVESAGLSDIAVVQPALWAIEISLAALWRSWGIEPDVLIGHSMGEVAAACVSGALDLRDGAAVICRRSALLHRHRGSGMMASVDLTAEAAQERLVGYEERLSIAAYNGPNTIVLAGEQLALQEILDSLGRDNVFYRRVAAVDIASHSPAMDGLRAELVDRLSSIRPNPDRIALHSTVFGRECAGTELDAAYWARNLRDPVRFASAVRSVAEAGETVFLELSPHPILVAAIEDCLVDAGLSGAAVGSLRRDEPERRHLLAALARLAVLGCPIDWRAVHRGGRHVSVPTYPWQHQRFWVDPPRSPEPPVRHDDAAGIARHPLMRHPVRVTGDADRRVWTGVLATDEAPYLRDHLVEGAAVLTGTAFVELMTAVATQEVGSDFALRDVTYHSPLLLPEPARLDVELSFTRGSGSDGRCAIRSRNRDRDAESGAWTLHTTAEVVASRDAPRSADRADLAAIRRRCTEQVSGAAFYRRFSERGIQWLGQFQAVEEIWCGPGEALAQVRRPESLGADLAAYGFHPVLLDACAQALAALLPNPGPAGDEVFMLSSIDEVSILGRPRPVMWSHAELGPVDGESIVGTIRILDESGACVAELRGARLRYLSREPGGRPPTAVRGGTKPHPDDWLHQVAWSPGNASVDGQPPGGAWLVLADRGGTGESLRARLLAAGNEVTTVVAGSAFARLGAGRYQVHPEDTGHFGVVLSERGGGSGSPDWAGIVHLWNLDSAPMEQAGPEAVAEAESLGCRSLARLIAAVADVNRRDTPRLWVATRGAQPVVEADGVAPLQAPVWGLGRAVSHEVPDLRCTLVDLDPSDTDPAVSIWDELCRGDGKDAVALRHGARYVPQLVRTTPPTIPPPRTSLDGNPRSGPGSGEVSLHVAFAGPNRAGCGVVGTITSVGADVTGLSVGDEVVAIAGPVPTDHVVVRADLCFRRPDRLTSAEAATIPVAFLTAYHALCEVGRVGTGQRVLIHSATDPVGLAAVQIAQWKGATVLATADSADQRAALRILGVRQVAGIRSANLVRTFQEATDGQGIDAIFNTLPADAALNDFDLLAPDGRYVDLSKPDDQATAAIPLTRLGRNRMYASVDIADMIDHRPERAGAVLAEVWDLVRASVLRPLPFHEFSADEPVGQAVLDVAAHTGAAQADPRSDEAGSVLRSDAAYLITGGGGDLGRRIAGSLVKRGARTLILTGRSAPSSTDDLRAAGATVISAAVDVADLDAMRALVHDHARRGGPPIRGVVHAAGAIRYQSIGDHDRDGFDELLGPKIRGAWVLHQLFHDQPLDFFVLFSSVSAVLASPMLSGYAAGNAFLDALAHYRHRRGLPAVSINWGPWSGTTMTTRLERASGRPPTPRGMFEITPDEGLAMFERVLPWPDPQVAIVPVDWSIWTNAHRSPANSPQLLAINDSQPVPVRSEDRPIPAEPSAESEVRGWPADRAALVRFLKEHVGTVLRLPADQVDAGRPLKDLGLDSLMAGEVRTAIRRELAVKLPLVRLLGDNTLEDVVEAVAELTPQHPVAAER